MVIAVESDAPEDALSLCDERGGAEGLDDNKDSFVVSGDVLETLEMGIEDELLSIVSAFVSEAAAAPSPPPPSMSSPALDEPRPAGNFFLNTNFRFDNNPARVFSNFSLSDFTIFFSPPQSHRKVS